MLDATGSRPDLELLLGPHDSAEFVEACDWLDRMGRRQVSMLYVVVQRRGADSWTQACRIVPDRRPGHLSIHVERFGDGDCRSAFVDWLRAEAARMRG